MTALALPSRAIHDTALGASNVAWSLQRVSAEVFDHFFGTLTAEPIEHRFASLAATWRDECAVTSSPTELFLNPSYQRIIGLGPAVLPSILKELASEPDYWFAALEAITGINPIKPEDFGNLSAMSESWVNWGRSERLIS